jgi:hypothetical protein
MKVRSFCTIHAFYTPQIVCFFIALNSQVVYPQHQEANSAQLSKGVPDLLSRADKLYSRYLMTTNGDMRIILDEAIRLYNSAYLYDTNNLEIKIKLLHAQERSFTSVKPEKALPELMSIKNEYDSLCSSPALTKLQLNTIRFYSRLLTDRIKVCEKSVKLNRIIESQTSNDKKGAGIDLGNDRRDELKKMESLYSGNTNDAQHALSFVKSLVAAFATTKDERYGGKIADICGLFIEKNQRKASFRALLGHYLIVRKKYPQGLELLSEAVDENCNDEIVSEVVLDCASARNMLIKANIRDKNGKIFQDEIVKLNPIIPLAMKVATNDLLLTKSLMKTNAILAWPLVK